MIQLELISATSSLTSKLAPLGDTVPLARLGHRVLRAADLSVPALPFIPCCTLIYLET